jgi:tetratricopeptide (TPR) repeat protein
MATFYITEDELARLQRQADSLSSVLTTAINNVSTQPDTALGLTAAGKIWELSNGMHVAVEFYSRALKVDPHFAEAKARLVINLVRIGRSGEALSHALELAKESPDFRFKTMTGSITISSMTVLGDAYRASGSEKEAIKAYEAAITLEPGDAYSAHRLTELKLHSGQLASATELEEKLDPDYSKSLLAVVSLAKNNLTDKGNFSNKFVGLLPAITNIYKVGFAGKDGAA